MSIKDAIAIRKPTALEILREQLVSTQALLVRAEQENASLKTENAQHRADLSSAHHANDRFRGVRSDILVVKQLAAETAARLGEIAGQVDKALGRQ